jgi:hypothetical protein
MFEIWLIVEPLGMFVPNPTTSAQVLKTHLAITMIFIATTLINRQTSIPHPATHRYHHSYLSRLMHRLPYLLETWYWVLNYFRFQLARLWTVQWINAEPVRKLLIEEKAKTNAVYLLGIEEAAGIDFELEMVSFVALRCKPWVAAFLNGVRASQAVLVVATWGYAYTYALYLPYSICCFRR